MIGRCDQAIVGTAQINLLAAPAQIMQFTRVNACDGIPKVWDEKADGFVKGEAIVCFLLQKKSDAKRIYATVLNSGVNIDGFKKMGMFFPSTEIQTELILDTCKEVNVNPLDITYIEAHATGTKVRKTIELIQLLMLFILKGGRHSGGKSHLQRLL